jgi:hypothetical protein
MRAYFIALLILFSTSLHAQNKSGFNWIIGAEAMYATFSGDTSRPVTGQMFSLGNPYYPHLFVNSQSNICDSATGKLLFMCNGMRIYDTLGNIMANGDNLQPSLIYNQGSYPLQINTQGSLILPKGSNGLYYVFIPTITDSTYTLYATSSVKFPYDLFQYHIVDMNANGGMGQVIQKNIPLLSNVEINETGMMACRHANGYDWWLLKQALDTNLVYTFLVTKDTVILDTIQGFSEPNFGYYDLAGQSCFSSDGSKYAFASGGYLSNGAHLFIADFDRCHGTLSNSKEIFIPLDSSLTPLDGIFGPDFDSLITGIAFSANDSFLYINRRYNIYQYELNESDSLLAWYHVQYGPDTTFTEFVEYGQMQRGIDNRIYIGKWAGAQGLSNSVIDHPNLKGPACGFCSKCLRYDTGIDYISSPPNMPDFNLGKKEPCWPVSNGEIIKRNEEIVVYPNPTSTIFYIKNADKKKKELYNSVGQLIFTTFKNEIDVSNYSKGIYYLRCVIQTKKIIIE